MNEIMSKESYHEIENKIASTKIPMSLLEDYFRVKCSICGHQRIAHNEFGNCNGVMNKPCSSGCDKFSPE